MTNPITVAVDFDGTLVEHEYPLIGKEVPHAVETVKELIKRKGKIILWTMRSGKQLEEAVKWCHDRGIKLYAWNHNPSQKSWSSSPKAYANIYIDDAALGCPLVESSKRPYVDWVKVRQVLKENGIL